MKYLKLPLHLIKFWYLESLLAFLRTWKHTLLYLEEDLAVGLMFKLLFTPLFHDASIGGRLLSFSFRSFRIWVGLISFFFSTLFIFSLALSWFLLPVLAVVYPQGLLGWVLKISLFSGLVLFVNHIVGHPHKKVKALKNVGEIWQASLIKKKDLNINKLYATPEVTGLLSYLEITPDQLRTQSQACLDSAKRALELITPENLDLVLTKTLELGQKLQVSYLGPEHFLVGILAATPDVDEQLLKLNLKIDDFIDALDFLERKRKLWRTVFIWDEDFQIKHLKGTNRGWLGVPTPSLDLVSEDLTRKAAREKLADFVGRKKEVKRVIDILSQNTGRNVVIVGQPGSGRDALVEYLAKLIIAGDAPKSLATKRLVRLDGVKLLAGTAGQGDLAEKIKNIFEEVKYSGNIIVYIEEIQNLSDLYSLLLPYIEGSDFQFVTVTDEGSYTKTLEKNQSFAHLFTKVELPPAAVSDTITILKNRAVDYERYKKIKTSLLAIDNIAQLSNRFIHDKVLPDSALSTFEQCLPLSENSWVKKKIVESVIQSQTAVPVGEVGTEIKKELLNLEEEIHQEMIDQEEAVSSVAKTLRRAAASLRETTRPIGSFLFVGPTGVGKTELSKILAKVYFQGKGHFFRLDMSEYQTQDGVEKLIGKSGEEGQLTEEVFLHPYCLILLDEFEKADSRLLTLFLQVLDDGRLTSGSGKVVDFTNTIIIATSNAASLTIAQSLEGGLPFVEVEKKVKDELLTIFKPELINRFDEVAIFKPLSKENLQKIVKLKLVALQDQLKDQGYMVDFDQNLIEKLAEKGFDKVLGARPLRRLIQDGLEARLSVMILEDKLPKGEKYLAGEDLLI